MTYHLYAVDAAGTHLADLTPKVTDWSVADELDAPGGIDFTLPIRDPLVASVPRLTQIQAWRDSTLLKWGVVTRRRAGRSNIGFQCAGSWWYFKRRFVGRARTNYVVNGNFETGDLTGWGVTGVTAQVVTHHHTDGGYGAELWQVNPGVDTFISQQFAAIPGVFYTFTAKIHIYADTPYAGPAFENRGLWVEMLYPGPDVVAASNAPIDDSYVPGQTYKITCGITVPADAPVGTVLEVRLMAPGGHIMWDSVRATIMESLSFPMTDIAAIADALIAHAQDPAYGKNALGIGAASPASGVLQSRFFQFADRQNIGDIIEEMAHAGQLDFDIVSNAGGTTRTFVASVPTRGSYKPAMSLTVTQSASDSCLDFEIDDDDEESATSIIAQGDGDGPDREEATAIDASYLGGLILEKVVQANQGTPIDALGPLATEQLRAGRKGATTATFTTKPGSDRILGLSVGDTTDATVTMGSGYSFSQRVRLVRKEINPRNDTAALTVNLT